MTWLLGNLIALDADPKIEPCGLSGHGIGICPACAIGIARQLLVDQVVEQEGVVEFGCTGVELPCAFAFADRIPGPDRSGRCRCVCAGLGADASARCVDPDPVAV